MDLRTPTMATLVMWFEVAIGGDWCYLDWRCFYKMRPRNTRGRFRISKRESCRLVQLLYTYATCAIVH